MDAISFTQLAVTSGGYITATTAKLLASKTQAGQMPPDNSPGCGAPCARCSKTAGQARDSREKGWGEVWQVGEGGVGSGKK